MTRLLVVLLAVVAALLLSERRIEHYRTEQRSRAGRLRPFAAVDEESVRVVRIGLGDRSWTYQRRGSSWHYPAYFDAFVLGDRMRVLLSGLLASQCTPVSVEPGQLLHYGLDPASAVRVTLEDGRGGMLLSARIGRGAPGRVSAEAYAQRAGVDTMYHLHANPVLALDNPVRPMVDPRVLPGALERSAPVAVRFSGGHAAAEERLRRVELPPDARTGLAPGPAYAWLGLRGSRSDTCAANTVYAYLGYLRRLRYAELAAWNDFRASEPPRWLEIEDEQGRVDTLEIGDRGASGNVMLRNRGARLVLTVTPTKAQLLLPGVAALLDSLPDPSPYTAAEPY